LRQFMAERSPGLDAEIEIEVQVEPLAALLETVEALANAIDLLPGCAVLLQLGPRALDGLLQRLRRVRPMMQGRPEAVVLARLVDVVVELRGLDRCLQHQAGADPHRLIPSTERTKVAPALSPRPNPAPIWNQSLLEANDTEGPTK